MVYSFAIALRYVYIENTILKYYIENTNLWSSHRHNSEIFQSCPHSRVNIHETEIFQSCPHILTFLYILHNSSL
mgnify:FL=1